MSSRTIPESARRLELPLECGGESPGTVIDWTAEFGRPGPNAIEIGTGNGLFLEAEAARCPEFNFLGIEREAEFYWKMVKRCARAGLTNVRTTRVDAIDVLRECVEARALSRIYCYFSDPWPKRRHAARRVMTDAFPPLIEPLLEPNGEFWCKTDVGWYFNFALTIFRARRGWTVFDAGRKQEPKMEDGEAMTNFERKARDKGGEVWGFKAKWVGEGK